MADDDKTQLASKRGYFGEIVQSAKSIMEGMAITLAELTRAPHNTTTVQYPDRTPHPVAETLPERYRGFLEVDLDACTGCKACERDCPINVIAIDLEKVGTERMLTRFDIDMGKCMYCGICVESCPVEVRAIGDAEPTKTIRMTREFEAATGDFHALTFRFIRPGDQVPPLKPKKGAEAPVSPRRGEIARAVRAKAAEYNPLAAKWALENMKPALDPAEAEWLKDEAVLARASELAPMVAAIPEGPEGTQALVELLYNQALAQTDSGHCGHPNCHEYARAIAEGRDREYWKCGPGGAQATRDLFLITDLRVKKTVEEAAKNAAAAAIEHHK